MSSPKRDLCSPKLRAIRRRNTEDDIQTQVIQYVPVEEAEQIEKYEPGGYHPVQIGDHFGLHGRYQLIHKVGFGGHSTTWLARDGMQGTRYVALKIAAASDAGELQESRMLRQLGEILHDEADREHIPTVLDAFIHNCPNGTHDCLVTESGMCSLAASKSASKGVWFFDLAVARRRS